MTREPEKPYGCYAKNESRHCDTGTNPQILFTMGLSHDFSIIRSDSPFLFYIEVIIKAVAYYRAFSARRLFNSAISLA